MMLEVKAPGYLWKEAMSHQVWLRNRSKTSALKENVTPHEKATGKKPNLAGIPMWGSQIWVKVKRESKVEPKAMQAMFVGVDSESKGFRVLRG